MKVRCNLCGKIFTSFEEYLTGPHDKRVHDTAEPHSMAVLAGNWAQAFPGEKPAPLGAKKRVR